MLKLLIVDDEQIEREGLQAILNKGFPTCQFAEARNGAKAIETAAEWQPDLVLMDVKMPGINGLEAIERIAALLPMTKFIMVTAYDTFEYAKQALKLGVKDYVLKPSKASEIISIVGKVIEDIRIEKTIAAQQREEKAALRKMMPLVEADVVTQLLFDRIHDVHISDMLQLLGAELTSEAFILLVMLSGESQAEAMYAAVKGKIRQTESGWVGAMSGRQIPIIVFREAGKTYRSQANSLVQQLLMLRQREPGGELRIGVGGPYTGLDNVKLSYQEAMLASAQMGPSAKHRFYGETEADRPSSSDKPDKESEKQFIEHIRQGKWETVREAVLALLARHDRQQTPLTRSAQEVLERLWIIARVAGEMGIEVEKPLFSFQVTQYEQLRAETEGLLGKLISCIAAYQSSVLPDAARQMKQYIIENSEKDITLEGMALRIGLSPFYMSKMFKDHEGINYIDFLTECRIEKAKKLMADPERSLKEITFEIGYNDPNYFSKVFKKVCGATPSEYRKAIFGH